MTFRRTAAGAASADVLGQPVVGDIDRTLMLHLRATGGAATHLALLVWARQLGFTDEDLDRCLVRASHAGTIAVDVGTPPCTATRVAHLIGGR
jgi:hypothetical protein